MSGSRNSRADVTPAGQVRPQARAVRYFALGLAVVALALGWDSLAPVSTAWGVGLVAPSDVYARADVRLSLPPTDERKSYEHVRLLAGEAVVRRGERITPRQALILERLGEAEADHGLVNLVGLFVFVLALATLAAAFIAQRDPKTGQVPERLLLFFLAICAAIIAMKLLQLSRAGRGLMFLLNPLPAVAILLALVLGQETGVFSVVVMSPIFGLLCSHAGRGSNVSYALLGGVVGALCVSPRRSQRGDIIKAGLAVASMNAAVTLSLNLMSRVEGSLDTLGSIYGASVHAFLNGVVGAIVVIGLVPVLERFFKVTTTFKLQELINPSLPLLQRLINEAPGTYHHAANVAYLAEGAAKELGADGYLAKAAAYYHDVGKLKRPYFFAENQMGGVNYHDQLSPHLSRLIITSHTKDGLELAERYGLPKAICDVILQHHGTDLVSYFYHGAKAQEGTTGPVEEHTFRYPGPKPQTKEAAVVMLADAVEAAARTIEKPTPTAIERLVHKITNDRFVDGQFDECELTRKDLETVAESLSHLLSAMYHSRVSYPEEDELLVRPPLPPPPPADGGDKVAGGPS